MTSHSEPPRSSRASMGKVATDLPAQADTINPPAQDTTANPPAEDSDSGSFWEIKPSWNDPDFPPVVSRERHDDHWDRVDFENIWLSDANDWTPSDRFQRGDSSKTNAELGQRQEAQDWLKKIPLVQRYNIHTVLNERRVNPDGTIMVSSSKDDDKSIIIPLFEDENGDEYQLWVAVDPYTSPQVYCPKLLGKIPDFDEYYYQLKARITNSDDEATKPSVTIPKFAISLGGIQVRTKARPELFKGEMFTEMTDFSVIVDVGSDDMPLWIVAPREQLRHRYVQSWTPLFKGLINSKNDYYDIACIMPSIRCLSHHEPDADGFSFQEACKLVRKTRAITDPVALFTPAKDIKEFFKKEPVSKPIPSTSAHSERLWEGLERVWAFWTRKA